MASHALAGARWRRAASEGSLPPTGWEALESSGAGGAAREGGSTSAQTRAVVEGRGVMLKGDQERIRRGCGDVIWRSGGRSDRSRGYE